MKRKTQPSRVPRRVVAVAIVLIALTGSANAALIDFEGLPFTLITSGGNKVPNPASVLTNDFMNLGVLFGRAGVSTGVAVVRDSLAPSSGLNSVSGLDANGILPGAGGGAIIGDIFFSFVGPGTMTPSTSNSVSFTIGDAGGDNDVFQIRAFNLGNTLINTQNVSGTSRFSVSIVAAGIHRVEVDFMGTFGYSLDDLRFEDPQPAPEPGTMLLIGLGLVGTLGYVRRRSR